MTLLADASSTGGLRLFEAFAEYFERGFFERLVDALHQLSQSEDESLRTRVSNLVGRLDPDQRPGLAQLARILDRASELQPDLKRIDSEIDDETRRIGNRILRQHPGVIDELADHLRDFSGDDREDEDEDEDDLTSPSAERGQTVDGRRQASAQLFIRALRRKARAVASGRKRVAGRAGRVLELVGDRLPPDDDLIGLGFKIIDRMLARILAQAPRQFVMGAPGAYARFRNAAVRDGEIFRSEVTELARQGTVSGDEVDVMILAMLRNARRLLEAGRWTLSAGSSHEWLENIRREHLTQVFVDEATDFSTVQIACTMELSHPRLRSWFACGDFNQRITRNGLQSRSDIEWLEAFSGQPIEMREVRIGYRQSRRLRELAAALSGDGDAGRTDAPSWGEEADVWPLLAENSDGSHLVTWLGERIREVETSVGRLPSVAIFVDGRERIDPLVELLAQELAPQNIRVVGCPDGRDVGDDLEV